ncbi:hypothetical protein ABS768_17505 [Flavobacterium sp. ST-75]|uniref:Uncharacterized protein n=1 Tax=Flavobacterium rhizophilum TaxID=3163296 RepID=A0ABW8YJA8_9FLAO
MKKLIILLLLFWINKNYSQNKEDCKTSFYKGKLISQYNIYEVKDLGFDTLSIKKNDIIRILKAYKDEKVIMAINNIVSNHIFLELVDKYALSFEHDEFSLDAYANKFIGEDIYSEYAKNKNVLDSVTKRLITDENQILNVSLYTNLEKFGDCYFYQMGYNNFNFNTVSNSVITSVLYDIDNSSLNKKNLLGIEITTTGQVIIIPVVSEGKYVCDIRLMLCPSNW